MRFALASLMALHGIAHLAGFSGSFHLTAATDLPYKTTLLELPQGRTGALINVAILAALFI